MMTVLAFSSRDCRLCDPGSMIGSLTQTTRRGFTESEHTTGREGEGEEIYREVKENDLECESE